MRDVLVYADQGSWLQLPASFPTESGELPREWENGVVARMREAWPDGMDALAEEAVREALRHGLRRVRSEDSLTLQYWPSPTVVNALVHIVVSEFDLGEQPQQVPLDEDLDYLTAPAVDSFESEHLGVGVEARYISAVEDSEPKIALGGVNYLFTSTRGFVYVEVEPTIPQLLGAMLDPVREVVRSIRVGSEGESDSWEKATVDPEVLEPYGDTWNIEPAGGIGSL